MWILIAFVIAGVICRYFGVNIFLYKGHSMESTYLDGDILLTNRLIYWLRKPKIGECVILKDPNGITRYLHKRVDRTLQSNGMVMVYGDNFQHSRDSRQFGPVDTKKIVARTELVLFNYKRRDRFFKRIKW